jgi:hypothetical protein
MSRRAQVNPRCGSLPSTIYHPETPAPLWGRLCRIGRRNRQRGVDQLPERPRPIRQPENHSWRLLVFGVRAEALMNAAQIVVGNVQTDGRTMVVQLLAKAVCEPREPS